MTDESRNSYPEKKTPVASERHGRDACVVMNNWHCRKWCSLCGQCRDSVMGTEPEQYQRKWRSFQPPNPTSMAKKCLTSPSARNLRSCAGHRPHSNFAENMSGGIKSLVSDITSVNRWQRNVGHMQEEQLPFPYPCSRRKTFAMASSKWFRNLIATVPNSSLPYGKWWCAGHWGPPECQTLASHCLWYPGIRSLPNCTPHAAWCQN
jgi:hypothetical protein